MKKRKYAIYKMYNKELGVYNTEFFLPDDSLRRKLDRLRTLSALKDQGYLVISVSNVDKETYLNERLSLTVDTYLYEDRAEQELKRVYEEGLVSEEVYSSSMSSIRDVKWTCLKTIDMQVRRIIRNDFSVENEIALQLYDHHYKEFI